MKILLPCVSMLVTLFFTSTLYAADVSKTSANNASNNETTADTSLTSEQVTTPTDNKTSDESATAEDKSASDNKTSQTNDASVSDDAEDNGEDESTTSQNNKDPLEGFNRAMFSFNEAVDKAIMKPLATLYNKIMPKPLNKGIHNAFYNINTLTTVADDLLQGNFYQATNDTWRIAINTTIGIGGLFDIAQRMKLEPFQNDFGLTLARWGWANSTYLVLPFFGPNTIRDGIGIPVDYFAFSIYPYIEPESTRYQIYALGVVDRRAQLLKFQNVLEEAAIDKYVFVRNAYQQRRAYQIDQVNHLGLKDRESITEQTTELTNENYD